MESLEAIVARYLRAYMDKHHLSEPKMAKRGVPTGSLNRALNGQNITLASLEKLAKAMNVDPWKLLVPTATPDALPRLFEEAAFAEAVEKEVKARTAKALSEMARLYGELEEDRSDGRSSGKPFGSLTAPRVEPPSDPGGGAGEAAAERPPAKKGRR